MSSYNALYLLAARHLRWVWFHSTGGCLPALIFMALAICSPPMAVASSPGKGVIPPVHPGAPFTPRVLSLLFGLTVDEKISLVHGDYNPDPASVGQVGYLPGVPRLGIPERRDADALGIEVVAESTAPPARLGLGATFDRGAVYALGQLEGKEGRALGVDLIYAPQVELVRQPNWVRNNTTFGEDPFLSGQLGIQEVIGIQSSGLMAQVKHYSFYNGQAGRGGGSTVGEPTLPTVLDDQTAQEIYLKPFEYAIREGQPSSVMASYQGFKIVPVQQTPAWATDNPLTLNNILRDRWDFRGFVLSDYGATHSVHALLSGLDQEYPGMDFFGLFAPPHYQPNLKPLVDPTSSSYDPQYARALDMAVARVLYAYERFGLLESASPAGLVAIRSPAQRPDINRLKDAHAAVAEDLSEKSAVLLKNEGGVLPLKGSDLQSVAVIGPTGRQVMVHGGQFERSLGFSDRVAISPFQVLQELAPANSNFTFAPGIDWIGSVVPASALPGGLQRTQSDSNAVQTDATIDYGSSSGQDDLQPKATFAERAAVADDNGEANSGYANPSDFARALMNSLAANQDALISAVAQANPNTVVVLSTGGPVLMPWLQDVKAVLEMWFPGQEGGTATAKLLLGQANPSGKLPLTWPANEDQTPFVGHPERITGDGTQVVFSEGLFMGYRWYDQQKIQPLFAFGHGLSYTQFKYSRLEIRPDRDGLEVRFALQNTGSVAGAAVPQIYVGPPSSPPQSVQFAPQKLVGFERVELGPGRKKQVRIHISNRELSYWSTALQRWVLPGGKRTISVGDSSRDFRLQALAAVRGER